jgi:SAM-dependent methyltransferase
LKHPLTEFDYLAQNQRLWTEWSSKYAKSGRRSWTADDATWGIWGVPESEARLLPVVADRDVLELGCGTAYVSSWIQRRGGRAVGLDATTAQLETAVQLQREFDLSFPLVQAVAENVPLADDTFDVIISEYGASIWSDPYRWVPEASRLLRTGGELVFLLNAMLLVLCLPEEDEPVGDRLRNDYFGMHRFETTFDDSIEFHLGHGDWIRLLRANGFEIEDLVELRPGAGAHSDYDFVTLEWARRWPSEEAWKVRKTR